MKTFSTLVLAATVALLISSADASIFLTKMSKYLNDPTFDTLKELGIWQIGGLLFPILAGPLRVVAYIFWTAGEGETEPFDEMFQAKMFLDYGITSFDSFNGYWMDYIIYGMIYPMIGLSVDFVEIDFAAILADGDDLLCYNLNGYGTSGGGVPDRTPTGDPDVYTGAVTC